MFAITNIVSIFARKAMLKSLISSINKCSLISRLAFISLLLGCGILFFPNISHGATYYVNNSLGTDDVSHGTAIDSDAWATLKYALTGSRVAKGDTVYLQAGTWAEDQTNVAVGAGDGNAVTVAKYNDDVVTIQTGTVTNGLFFINSIDMTFDGVNFDNNDVAMGAKYIFGLYSTTTTVDLTFQNASIDGDNSSGYIRLFKLYGTQPHNVIINKADITNGGIVVEAGGSGGTNNNVTFFSSIVRSGYVVFYASTSSATTLVLKNNLFTRQTGYGFLVSSASSTVDAKNNIFIGGGAFIQNIWNIGTDFGLAAIANNALFDVTYNYYYSEDSPFTISTFGEIISSVQVVPYISKLNWFVNPSFTSLGTDYTLAAGSLVAQRGTNDHPTDGTDINGTTYGTNDVGPYVNPTLTALPSLDASLVGWQGDSIMNGTGAVGEPTKSYSVYDDFMTDDTVNNYGLGGQFTRGLFWTVDQSIWTGRESSVVLSIGINDIVTPRGSQTNAQVSSKIVETMEKIADAGITPIFLGISSITGNPPDNADVDAVYDTVATSCTSEGWDCNSIQTQMENNADWKTDYYDDLTTNVHPNDAGHAIFARLAEYLSFSKSTMGTDEVDIGAGARLYYDGEFRNIGTPSAVTADFTVTPVGGVGTFDSDDRSGYMDITITTWETTGNQDKLWTGESSSGDGYVLAGSTVYTIGDLAANSRYQFKLDSAASTAITGTTCTGGYCWSDSSGSLTFTYTGGYSSHTFGLNRIGTSPTTISSAPEPSISTPDDEIDYISGDNGTCEEGFVAGEDISLSWSTSSSVNLVNVYYSTDLGEAYTFIEGPITNTENYTWTIPVDIAGSTLQFKIEGTDLAEITASFETESCVLSGADDDAEDVSTTDDSTSEAVAPSGTGISPVTGEEEEITAVEPGDYITSPSFSTVYYVTESYERRAFISSAVFFTYADSYDEIVDVTDATLTALELEDNMLPNPGVVLVKVQSDAKTYAVDSNYNLRWITSEEIAIELYGDNWADYIIDVEATFFASFGAGDDVDSSDDITLVDMKTREEVSQ
ncbi:hypothetical protein HN358_03875 [Candidatus Uhrbacteria bacterium]|jgi:lysophospholipase L1-like esterase|nr:hypothetical protein [Candidatus Uhrbacteria bacterium]